MLIKFDGFCGQTTPLEMDGIYVWSQANLASNINSIIKLYQSDSAPSHFLKNCGLNASFALFDKAKGILIASKDFFGVSPLFFSLQKQHLDESFLIRFGFSVKDLLCVEGFSTEPNLSKIKDYLSWANRSVTASSQTFFKDIYRLLPAHALVLQNGEVSIFPYSKLNLAKNFDKPNRFFTETFEQRFAAKIAKYVSPDIKLATSLSGGLDSSAITAVAQSLSKKPVTAFHIAINSPFTQEKKFALSIVEKWKPDFVEMPPKDVVYENIKNSIFATGTPPMGVLPDICSLYFREPAKLGCNVLLMGEGGDQVIGMNENTYYDELYEKQDWKSLKTAFKVVIKHRLKASTETPAITAKDFRLHKIAEDYFAQKNSNANNLKEKLRNYWVLLIYFQGFKKNLIKTISSRLFPRKAKTANEVRDDLFVKNVESKNVAPFEIIEKLDVQQLCENPLNANQRRHLDGCYHELLANVLEAIDFLTRNIVDIKVDFPFLDKELLELCMTVPNSVRFDNGLRRGLLRQSLEKYLTPEIRNRAWKAHMSDYAEESFKILWRDFQKDVNVAEHRVWQIVNKKEFDKLMTKIESGNSINGHRWQTTRVIYLAIWLDYCAENGVNMD